MKCHACGNTRIDAAMGRCPLCGFPLMHMVGDGADPEGMLRKLSGEYREQKLSEITLGFLTYSHEMRAGRLVRSGVRERAFSVRACDLPVGEIVWEDGDFARIDEGEAITVTLVIGEGEAGRQVELSMEAPDTEGFWHVGLLAEPGFAVRVAVGDSKACCRSEAVPLLLKEQEGQEG